MNFDGESHTSFDFILIQFSIFAFLLQFFSQYILLNLATDSQRVLFHKFDVLWNLVKSYFVFAVLKQVLSRYFVLGFILNLYNSCHFFAILLVSHSHDLNV